MAARSARPSRRLAQRNARVQAHLDLVGPIASHYACRSRESTDDLDQVGRLGLIRAAELYDSHLAVPFSAYARRHVRGAILHYLRDQAPLVREPRRLQERRHQLRLQERQLTARLGRRPRPEELRCTLALSGEQWQELTIPSEAWQHAWLEEQHQHSAHQDWAEAELERRQAQRLRQELQGLEPRQRRILCAVVLKGQSLRAVAQEQGTSLATTHRQLQRALTQLRSRLAEPSAAPGC